MAFIVCNNKEEEVHYQSSLGTFHSSMDRVVRNEDGHLHLAIVSYVRVELV